MWCPLRYDGTALFDMANDGAGGHIQRTYCWRSRHRCFLWTAVLFGIDVPDGDEAMAPLLYPLMAAYLHISPTAYFHPR